MRSITAIPNIKIFFKKVTENFKKMKQVIKETLPRISLFDHVNKTKQLLHSNTCFPSWQLGGQLGTVFLTEGIALLEDAHEMAAGAEVGNMKNISEGWQHLHLIQNLNKIIIKILEVTFITPYLTSTRGTDNQ